MPTKHIDTHLWEKIVERTVETIIQTKIMYKDTDVLQAVIQKGLDVISTNELTGYIKNKSNPGGNK